MGAALARRTGTSCTIPLQFRMENIAVALLFYISMIKKLWEKSGVGILYVRWDCTRLSPWNLDTKYTAAVNEEGLG